MKKALSFNSTVSSLPIGQEAKFRIPRLWSNRELRKFAPLFSGGVVNVSGWTDEDKEGKHYKDYFASASEYWMTNYKSDEKGLQGLENEFFLDLDSDLDEQLFGKFDVVFNHTTLEHIYECRRAFSNICKMSRDVVIVVVPYFQQVHGLGYLDFWRFTPYTMKKMYEENGLVLRYCSANGADKASVYLFCIGYKSNKWDDKIPQRFDLKLDEAKDLYGSDYRNVIGGNVI